MEYLKDHLKPGNRVLDVGSGSGYLTACFWRFINSKGCDQNTKIVGIEHQQPLVKKSKENLNNDNPNMLSSEQVTIVGEFIKHKQSTWSLGWYLINVSEGDGRKGYSPLAPYHAIHVGAASPEKPATLLSQLAEGGRMIVPVGPEGGEQHMMQVNCIISQNKSIIYMKFMILSNILVW